MTTVKSISRTLPLLPLFALVVSCGGSLDTYSDQLARSGKCSSFNTGNSYFQMSIENPRVVGDVGGSYDISFLASWVNQSSQRESVNCTPDWLFSNPNAASLVGQKVTALQTGVTRITATVTGSSVKTVDGWFAVRPHITEQEPNNGIGFAQLLTVNGSFVGYADTNSDVDYYSADVPAGKSFQFLIKSLPDLPSGSPLQSTNYTARVLNTNGTFIGDSNQSYVNSAPSTQKVYVAISNISSTKSTDFPYSIGLVIR